MTSEQFVFVLWLFTGFLFASILFCWILFGVGWLKGWRDPNITPMQILERLTSK